MSNVEDAAAAGYVPAHRLDAEPPPFIPRATPVDREAALQHVLRGVELGAYDERLMAWLLRFADEPTLRTVLSWIERARRVEAVEEFWEGYAHGAEDWDVYVGSAIGSAIGSVIGQGWQGCQDGAPCTP
jgi:hypothetical protein